MLNSFPVNVYIGLGSNLDNPFVHIIEAILELDELAHSALQAVSSLYKSKPMGPADQPPYANAVACLQTRLTELDLLHVLQTIENSHGRVRKQHWGPRTLDLDILVYGNKQTNNDELTIPHPGIKYREFVLYPLHEINKNLMIPGIGVVHRIQKNCYPNRLIKLHD